MHAQNITSFSATPPALHQYAEDILTKNMGGGSSQNLPKFFDEGTNVFAERVRNKFTEKNLGPAVIRTQDLLNTSLTHWIPRYGCVALGEIIM